MLAVGNPFQQAARGREENIIPQPLRQADMPALPELGKVAREIRAPEVPGQLDSQQPADAAHDAGVPGKVVVQGKGIPQQPGRQVLTGIRRGLREGILRD